MPDPDSAASRPRVYVSYACEESDEHVSLVREFAAFLRTEAGVDAHLDQWYADGRRDWVAWASDQFQQADFIVVIASPGYGLTMGMLDTAMLHDKLGRSLPDATHQILPVVLPGGSATDIPHVLSAFAATHYVVRAFSLDEVQGLLRAIHGSPAHAMPPLGAFRPPTSKPVRYSSRRREARLAPAGTSALAPKWSSETTITWFTPAPTKRRPLRTVPRCCAGRERCR